jgi:hypothetical protein
MRRLVLYAIVIMVCWFAADRARGAGLQLPQNGIAGQPMTIGTTGQGDGTLYLVGPGQVIRHSIRLGSDVHIQGQELRSAGLWIAIVRSSDGPQSQVFWVKPAQPENLSFLARPSRAPVAQHNAISGTVFLFDPFHNLVFQPTPVNFDLSLEGTGAGAGAKQTVTSKEGVAWISASSGPKQGAAQFVASVGNVSVRRVVQQVAAEPCRGSLRMHLTQRAQGMVVVRTDPIRDCSGNPVPDGTIVSFIATDKNGKSTVDARIKKGVAQAELPASNEATISVASGVTLGNELHLGSGR